MAIDTTSAQRDFFPFSGAITRQQFSLVQRMLLPWWGSMSFTAICFFIVALAFDVGSSDTAGLSFVNGFASLSLAAALSLFVWVLTALARHRQWRTIQATQQEITGSISEVGLEWSTPMSTSKFPWSKIVKVRQHPEMLLIFYSANCAFYVPKFFFATEKAWNEANALTLRQVPANSTRIRPT